MFHDRKRNGCYRRFDKGSIQALNESDLCGRLCMSERCSTTVCCVQRQRLFVPLSKSNTLKEMFTFCFLSNQSETRLACGELPLCSNCCCWWFWGAFYFHVALPVSPEVKRIRQRQNNDMMFGITSAALSYSINPTFNKEQIKYLKIYLQWKRGARSN